MELNSNTYITSGNLNFKLRFLKTHKLNVTFPFVSDNLSIAEQWPRITYSERDQKVLGKFMKCHQSDAENEEQFGITSVIRCWRFVASEERSGEFSLRIHVFHNLQISIGRSKFTKETTKCSNSPLLSSSYSSFSTASLKDSLFFFIVCFLRVLFYL